MVEGTLRGAQDPQWADSGARTPAEYEFWAGRTCGIACFGVSQRDATVPAADFAKFFAGRGMLVR
ncbi:MAG: hypothetical protein ACRDN0_19320 [Trebonia sp.]